ncbi:hypothetical protein Tco_0871184 [Tanacetum coccineum]
MLCKPKPYYDEQNKVAIGYKNPLCLTRAKQVQPALYNGHEIIKINHVPAIVHNSKDTLEIAEITRKKMNDKMKDPECEKKVKIAPHDYSKEDYLATFTPQKQLTPEQIFWSKDLIKMKAEALKEQTTASRPIKALTVYPPNTPATLVPRVLPTKSQVKINIFALIQFFWNLKKPVKEIILRRADYQEYTIAEKDFKNLYPSDFEDLNMLLLQGHLNHLPGLDKRMLSTAVNLWTRNLLNLTKLGWDAKGFKYKHDYTIIESPRTVVFPVSNNERKIMRFNEIYKFSDGTLTNILEALDYRVKEYKVNWLNLGMNTRFWTDKDVIRSKEFIHAIERRLKTRMIFRNLECFVGGCVRDIDYRLLQRTE